METVILENPQKIAKALRLLVPVSAVPALTHQELKGHFRRRAQVCHPDTAQARGVNLDQAHRDFINLTRAYKFLDRLFSTGWKPKGQLLKQYWGPPAQGRAYRTQGGYPEVRPGETLRFGQFLVRKGLVTLRDLLDSLVWQGTRRPRFGAIAQNLGFLSPGQVMEVIKSPMAFRFGETARRLGYLSDYQVLVILGTQKRYRSPLGQYFLQKGLLTKVQLDAYLEEHRRAVFNSKVAELNI